jgi:hypothetical protein
MTEGALSIQHHFAGLRDPRRRHGQLHRLLDVIVIALCAVIAGSNTWQEVETFARHRREWLGRFLDLDNGVPSHDTFERVPRIPGRSIATHPEGISVTTRSGGSYLHGRSRVSFEIIHPSVRQSA